MRYRQYDQGCPYNRAELIQIEKSYFIQKQFRSTGEVKTCIHHTIV
ncbi:MAG: hypothetical protein ACOC7U_08030 [Spirochaetota bacterium]